MCVEYVYFKYSGQEGPNWEDNTRSILFKIPNTSKVPTIIAVI